MIPRRVQTLWGVLPELVVHLVRTVAAPGDLPVAACPIAY